MTSGLVAHQWEVGYSSDEDDLVSDFYLPAMSLATRYDRAAGYFSSQALAVVARGVASLYERQGRMRLVASPVLSLEDREAILLGERRTEELIGARLQEYLDPARLAADERLRLELLAGMVACGLLEIRLAIRDLGKGKVGLFHEKIGVFADEAQNYMTFIGSPNESWNGWVSNVESFALHTSWGPAAEYAAKERGRFERTWNKQREGVVVFDLPAAVREALFERFPPREPDGTPMSAMKWQRNTPTGPRFPAWLGDGHNLRPYQREAVNRWLEAGGRGVFAMATGTGKTITALAASISVARAAAKSRQSLLVLVVAPSKDLVTQWKQNAVAFGYAPVCCHSDESARWPAELDVAVQSLRYASPAIEMVVTTADTLLSERFSSVIQRYTGTTMLIADEMHSLGTPRRLAALPPATYRLGLSATPRRHGDEHGTRSLLNFFGPVVQRIDIAEAIRLGALVPYSYHPILVPMSETERARYAELSQEIARKLAGAANVDDALDDASFLLRERARLLNHAEAKLPALRSLMKTRADSSYNLVYVAEGVHPVTESNQLERVTDMLGGDLGMKVNTYTGTTPTPLRATYQSMLRAGQLQALIAMRCLDEGIDIPEARHAFILASTQNPRQFVQRRGRVLRRDDQGGKTSAEIYDLLVVPEHPPARGTPEFRLERRLVGRELSRALELASASRNGCDVPPAELREAMERYDLLELLADYLEPPAWDEDATDAY